MAIVIISGPSGVGKGTVIEAVRRARPELHLAISATTRRPRVGERDGRDYHFLSTEAFIEQETAGAFLEVVSYAGQWYGTPRTELREQTLIECDVEGAQLLKAELPEAVAVFLTPPSMNVLEARLRGRGTEDDQQIATRLTRAAAELNAAQDYDRIIIAEDVATSAQAILELLDVGVLC